MKIQKIIASVQSALLSITESTAPSWDLSATRIVDSANLPDDTLPTLITDVGVLSVQEHKSAGVILKPTSASATYSIQAYAFADTDASHDVNANSYPLRGVYKLDGGLWEGLTGETVLGFDVQLCDGLFLQVTSLTEGSLILESYPVAFQS